MIGPTCERAFLTRTTVYRAREICIGIVSADVVLAGTDFGGARLRFARDSPLEGAVRCELVSAAGSDSAAYEFLESIKKEGPQPSDALPPFSCNQN